MFLEEKSGKKSAIKCACLVKNVFFPARNSTSSCPILLFAVLCKRWVFPLISSCVDCSAFLSSSSAFSWNFRLLLVVVVGIFLEFPPSSSCCHRRPSWGFRLVPQASEYLPRALPMSCFGEKCLQEKEIFQKSLQGYVFLRHLLLLLSFEKKRFFIFFEDNSWVLI